MFKPFQMKERVNKEKKGRETVKFLEIYEYLARALGDREGQYVGRFVLASVGAIEPP